MNGWEKWGKRFFKWCLWATVFLFAAALLDLKITWQLMAICFVSEVSSRLFDVFLPTELSQSSGDRK
jgi:hypothetical protein